MMRVARRATSAGEAAPGGASGDQVVDRSLAAAVHDERVAGLEEVFRHGPAHEAEPDESDVSVIGRSIARRPVWRLRSC